MIKIFSNFIINSIFRFSKLEYCLITIIGIIIAFALGNLLSKIKIPKIISLIGYLLIYILYILILGTILISIAMFLILLFTHYILLLL